MTKADLGRLLVVDDEAELLAVLSEKLTRQGYHVMSFSDPREALRVLQSESFDVLLTDMMMPAMDGVALVRAALGIDPHLACIIMTGQATVQTAVEAMKVGVLDYILKPFKTPALLPVLARALEFRRLRLENVNLREAAAIDNLCKTISFTTDLNAILNKIVDGALEQCEAEEASIMLPTCDGRELCISAIKGAARGGLLGERVPIDQGVAGWVARTHQPLTLEGEVQDHRFAPRRPREDIRWAVCMPMLVGGRLVGVLNVNSTHRRQPYSLGQIKALGILASAGATAIDRALLVRHLSESESRYRSIFENANEGICRTTLQGVFRAINPAYARMLGYDSPDEFRSHSPNAADFYENSADREELWRLLQEQGVVQGFEVRLVRRDGRSIWVSINGRLIQSEGGETLFDCTVEDITDRKQAEDSLRLFRKLLDHSTDAVEVIDPDTGRFLDMNAPGYRGLGYEREEVLALGVPDIEMNFLEQRITWQAAVEEVRRVGGKILEGRHRRKDGSTFPVEINVTFTHLDRDYLVAVVRDITERKQAEQRLEAQHAVTSVLAAAPSLEDGCEQLLRVLCQTMVWTWGALWVMDPSRAGLRCLRTWHDPSVNCAEFQAMTIRSTIPRGVGFAGQVWAAGRHLWVPSVERDDNILRAKCAAECGLTSAIGFPIVLETRFLGVMEFFHSELPRPSAELLGMMSGVGSQIGQFIERKWLEEQFRQAQKLEAIGQLAGGVAHDFNNLLTVINGYSELAFARMRADDPSRELLAEIKQAGERAASLTSQLLLFSRKQVLQPKVLDLNKVIEELTRLLRRLIGEDVSLVFAPGRDLGAVKVDPGQLEQALINLAVNARDAMPHGGQLTLETQNVALDASYSLDHFEVRPGRYVLVAVTDTGHGMDEGTKSRIFEPFFTTKPSGKGTGLGLAMVFGFVRQSGGNIQVYSEVGRGTAFKIYLPRVEENLTESAIAQERFKIPGGTETVLLVEDEEGIRSLSSLVLRSSGYQVLEAKDGQNAIEVAQRHRGPIHILVTDVVMPGMGGRQVANLLAGTRPGIRILFVSGYTDDAVVRHGVLEQGVWFLQKPFTATTLATKVREVLDS